LEVLEAHASVLSKSGDFAGAAGIYEQLIARKASRTFAWQVFWNRYRSGDHLSSYQALGRALAYAKKDASTKPAAHYWRGLMLMKLGRQEEASREWSKIENANAGTFYKFMARQMPMPPEGVTQVGRHREDISFDPKERELVTKMSGLLSKVFETARRFNVDPGLVLAVIHAESRFQADATSLVGARGLMQLMPYTAVRVAKILADHDFSLSKMTDPETNIAYGVYYLKLLLDHYDGSFGLAVAAYNAGPSAVSVWQRSCVGCRLDEFIESITYRETRKYVREVLGTYSRYRGYDSETYAGFFAQILPQTVKDVVDIF
jgi:soluble lytic murein transglycosylase-like protein